MSHRVRFASRSTLNGALAVGLLTSAGFAQSVLSVPSQYSSIQAAIDAAESGDEIHVSGGSYRRFEVLDKSLTVIAVDGPSDTIVDGGGSGPVLHVVASSEDTATTVSGFTFTGGVSENGGGLFLVGHATLEDALVTGNEATNGGGAFLFGSPTLRNVRFVDNSAGQGGGAFAAGGSTPTFENCHFGNNFAEYAGGGLYAAPEGLGETEVTLIDTTFSRNSATEGGAVAVLNATLDLRGGEIEDNDAGAGGGLYAGDASVATLTNASLVNNTAPIGAAAFASSDTAIALVDTVVTDNDADDDSGALHGDNGEVMFADSQFGNNFPEDAAGNTNDMGGNVFGAAPCTSADLAQPFGVVDSTDTTTFIDAFLSGNTAADLAAPFNQLDMMDMQEFIISYLSGCP